MNITYSPIFPRICRKPRVKNVAMQYNYACNTYIQACRRTARPTFCSFVIVQCIHLSHSDLFDEGVRELRNIFACAR